MPEMIFSVSELNAYVGALLGQDPHLRDLTVRGEISGFKRHSSGHLYFSLKDAGALVRCVMFKSQAMKLDFRPEDGMQVRIRGYASLYARDGSFQIYAQSMAEEGAGALYARFLALKERLETEGYFDPARKKTIPFLPRCVGVVTSGTGAAIQDVLQIIGRRFPNMPICLCPVKVQGEGAAEEIAAGIRTMDKHAAADVLIVGRGGGSIEDLWAFNEPVVAKAIYDCSIPIISAVGHETDFTIADFVADLRAPTPSAAAELAVPSHADAVESLGALHERLSRSLETGIARRRDRLDLLLRSAGFHAVGKRLSDGRFYLDALSERMERAVDKKTELAQRKLERFDAAFRALDPDAVLQRGYAVVSDASGMVISDVSEVRIGDAVNLRLKNGSITADVKSIEKEEQSHHGTDDV